MLRLEIKRQGVLDTATWDLMVNELLQSDSTRNGDDGLQVSCREQGGPDLEWTARRAYRNSDSLTVDYSFPRVMGFVEVVVEWEALGVENWKALA